MDNDELKSISNRDLPQPIIEAYGKGELAVLVGSGLSLASDVKGNFPRWADLRERLLTEVSRLGVLDAARIAELRPLCTNRSSTLEQALSVLNLLKVSLGRDYQSAMARIFLPKDACPGDVHRSLVEMALPLIVTTNYDRLLELAERHSSRLPFTWKDIDNALNAIEHDDNVRLNIHGTASNADTVIMTDRDYVVLAQSGRYQLVIQFLWQRYTFLMVGYGINDPLDLDLVFRENADAFKSGAHRHYVLMREAQQSDIDRWLRNFNIQVIPYDSHDELPGLLRAIRQQGAPKVPESSGQETNTDQKVLPIRQEAPSSPSQEQPPTLHNNRSLRPMVYALAGVALLVVACLGIAAVHRWGVSRQAPLPPVASLVPAVVPIQTVGSGGEGSETSVSTVNPNGTVVPLVPAISSLLPTGGKTSWSTSLSSPTGGKTSKSVSPCRNTTECRDEGRCSGELGGCYAESLLDCRRSLKCQDKGYCTPQVGRCMVVSDDDCKRSNPCKTAKHRCFRVLPGLNAICGERN